MQTLLLMGIALVSLAFFGFYAVRLPDRAAVFLLAIIPLLIFLTGRTTWRIGPFNFVGSIKDILLMTMFCAVILCVLQASTIRRSSMDSITVLVLLYATWVGFCALRAPSSLVAFAASRAYLEFIVAFFVAKFVSGSVASVRWQYLAILAGGFTALCIGVLRLTTFDFSIAGSSRSAGRFSGIFPNERFSEVDHPGMTAGVGGGVNMYGVYLVIVVLIAFYYFLPLPKKPSVRAALFGFTSMAAFQLLLTFSRRAFAALIVAALFLLLSPPVRKQLTRVVSSMGTYAIIALVALMLLLAVVGKPPAQVLPNALSIELDPFDESRWYEAQRLISHSFSDATRALIGEGLGSVGIAQRVTTGRGTLHNSFLSVLVQCGAIGLTLLSALVLTAFYRGGKLAHSDSRWAPAAAITTAVLIALCVSGFGGDTLAVYPTSFFFWYFLGMLSAMNVDDQRTRLMAEVGEASRYPPTPTPSMAVGRGDRI